jgi:hypothetical protein
MRRRTDGRGRNLLTYLNATLSGVSVVGSQDPCTGAAMEQAADAFVLSGRVTDRHGRAVHRAHVVIWLQNIRDRIKLTECERGKDGRFDTWYTIPEHLRAKPLIVATASSKRLHAPVESPLAEAQLKLELNLSAPSLRAYIAFNQLIAACGSVTR